MTCVSNSFGRMVGSCCRTWRHCQTRRRGTSMNLNRRPCIHACRTRLTTNMFTVRAIAYPHYAVFMSGGRWRYRLSSIQHVTELHVQCWTTSDKWNQGADKPNKTTHAETYIFHTLLLSIRYAHVSCATFGMDNLGCWTGRRCQTQQQMPTTCVCPRQRFIRVPTATAYHIFFTTLIPFRCSSVTLCVNYFCSAHDCGAWPLLAVREIAGMALVMRNAMHACRTHW